MIKAKETARGEKGVGLRTTEGDLLSLPQDVPIASVQAKDIDAWLDVARQRGVSQRRLKNLRGSVITLFKWAQKKKLLPQAEKTAPELTEAITETRGRGRKKAAVIIYTREDVEKVIAAARSLDGERASLAFLVVIGAYAGIRTEEIAPLTRTKSEGLQWSDFDRKRAFIRVPAHVSKVGEARIVPVQPVLEKWLTKLNAPTSGPIMTCSFNTGLKHFQKANPGLWKKNALRHSYGTYRTAQTQDMPRVSLEMGNSVPMVKKHYFEAVSQEEGRRGFESPYDFSKLFVRSARLRERVARSPKPKGKAHAEPDTENSHPHHHCAACAHRLRIQEHQKECPHQQDRGPNNIPSAEHHVIVKGSTIGAQKLNQRRIFDSGCFASKPPSS